MILRQETIDLYAYDPDGPEARMYMRVVWKHECCGLVVTVERRGINQQCTTCARNKLNERKRQEKLAIKATATKPKEITFTEIEKEIHGQRVKVKVYETGAPADYIPSYLEI